MTKATPASSRQQPFAAAQHKWTRLILPVLLLLSYLLQANWQSISLALLRLSYQNSADADAMILWIRSNGGVVNVGVRAIEGRGKFTVALHNIKQGDELAVIPRKICFPGHPEGEWRSAAQLWAEMQKSNESKLLPYLQTLPARQDVRTYYDLPASYIPLIQNTALETATTDLHKSLRDWLHHHQQQNQRDRQQHTDPQMFVNMTLDDLRYALSLVKSRIFGTDFGQLMVPLIDLANHHNSCRHTITTYPTCGPGLEDGCIVWQAGADVAAGEEVCNIYHDSMLQDRAILQYGFLQIDESSKQMSSIDRHDYDTSDPWGFRASLQPFDGHDTAAVHAEIARLSALLSDMKALDARLKVEADPEQDADGRFLKQLMVWRQQRQAAIAREQQRLLVQVSSSTQI